MVQLCWRKHQTEGRGQMGANSWQSKAGQSLTFSMFKRFNNLRIRRTIHDHDLAVSLGITHGIEQLNIPHYDKMAERHYVIW